MAHIDDEYTKQANLKYIRKAMNAPMLEKEHELDLARRWRDDKDEKALHELVGAYRRLVVSKASKFKHYGLPIGDLIQEGNIGLMKAANRFEPERGHRFSTYATWWIRAAIQDYVLRNWSIVRTGTTAAQKSLFFNLRRLRAKIEGEEERQGLRHKDRKKIAEELDVKLKDVREMEGRILRGGDYSLNATIGTEGHTEWQAFLEDERNVPEEVVIGTKDARTRSKWLEEALQTLSDRERKIIRDRHLGHDVVTLATLGDQLGISKERVRQLESRAMDKIRASMSKHVEENEGSLFL